MASRSMSNLWAARVIDDPPGTVQARARVCISRVAGPCQLCGGARSHGGPDMAPKPPALVAPRMNRGAPRSRAQFRGGPDMARLLTWGPRDGPQTPHRSERP